MANPGKWIEEIIIEPEELPVPQIPVEDPEPIVVPEKEPA